MALLSWHAMARLRCPGSVPVCHTRLPGVRSNTPARFHQALPGLTQGRWPRVPIHGCCVTPSGATTLVPLVTLGGSRCQAKAAAFSPVGSRGEGPLAAGEGAQRLHPPGRGKSRGDGLGWARPSLPGGSPTPPALVGERGLVRRDPHTSVTSAQLGGDAGQGVGMGKGHPPGVPLWQQGVGVSCFRGWGSTCVVSTPAFSCPRSLPCLCLSFPTHTTWVSSPCAAKGLQPLSCSTPPPSKSRDQKSPGLTSPILAPTAAVPDGSPFDRDSAGFRHRAGGGDAGGAEPHLLPAPHQSPNKQPDLRAELCGVRHGAPRSPAVPRGREGGHGQRGTEVSVPGGEADGQHQQGEHAMGTPGSC